MSDNTILDLDTLSPEPKTVKFQGEILTVNSPKMSDLFALAKAGTKLDITQDNDVDGAMAQLQAALTKVIPGLEGKTLGVAQLLALSKLVNEMAMPATSEVEPIVEKKDQLATPK